MTGADGSRSTVWSCSATVDGNGDVVVEDTEPDVRPDESLSDAFVRWLGEPVEGRATSMTVHIRGDQGRPYRIAGGHGTRAAVAPVPLVELRDAILRRAIERGLTDR